MTLGFSQFCWNLDLIHELRSLKFGCVILLKPGLTHLSITLWYVMKNHKLFQILHYSDVIMSAMASKITSVSLVCSNVCWSADQRKHQRLTFAKGIYRWPVDYPHKGPVRRKMLPFDDVIMWLSNPTLAWDRKSRGWLGSVFCSCYIQ